jgi:predicted heme/steroid binding protein
MYVVGQKVMPDGYFGGYLSVINLSTNSLVASTSSAPNPVSISDGEAGAVSRMLLADDNTLWIGMTKCDEGERANNSLPYGCLTMYNTSTGKVALLEPFLGDLTGIADVEGLHKIYVAQGGQVYIYSTVNGASIDNQYVTVTGTAYDVAYMDATSDTNNTVY